MPEAPRGPAPSLAFDAIAPGDLVSALRTHVVDAERTTRDFFATPGSSAALVVFLDRVTERLDAAVTLAEHMDEMTGTDAWSEAHEAAALARERFRSALYASDELAARLAGTEGADDLSPAEAQILARARRAVRRGGAGLPTETRARIAQVDTLLVEKTAAFTRQLDAASRAFAIDLDDEARLAGLPSAAAEIARRSAAEHGLPGFRITLQMPLVEAILAHASDRELRKAVYLAHATRATGEGGDNRPLVGEILALRAERAALVGYASFADMVLDGRMKETAADARAFVDASRNALAARFERERASLAAFARARGCPDLEAWDVAYFAEHERRVACAFASESLRPYLPLRRVLGAVQDLTRHLFGVRWEPEDLPTWHPDVTTWSLWVGSEHRAFVYLDPLTREGKREGAWMTALAPCLPGRGPGAVVVATNIAPAGDPGAEPCLGLEDVARLLHEVGHAMHHVLSRTPWLTLTGTAVAWDFVELPSTLVERLLWRPEVLARIGAHVETGAPIPESVLEPCLAAQRFRAASALMARLGLARVDLALHDGPPPSDVVRVARELMIPFSPAGLPPSYARVASLGHVFGSAQGYEASLYAYPWAEVLAAEGIAVMGRTWEELAAAGARLRDVVLARGGEEDAGRLVEELLGHTPSARALLEQLGA